MKNSVKSSKFIWFILVVGLLGVGYTVMQAQWSANLMGQEPAFEASYANVSIDEQIEVADVIFVGAVIHISETHWNQDSGEYWEEVVYDEIGDTRYVGLPIYTIELLVKQPIVGNMQQNDSLIITVVGASPLEDNHESVDNEYVLQDGDNVVMFARNSELAWREGTKPILQLMSAPEQSYFLQGDDGLYRTAQLNARNQPEKAVSLDDLLTRIAQKRPTIVQPQSYLSTDWKHT